MWSKSVGGFGPCVRSSRCRADYRVGFIQVALGGLSWRFGAKKAIVVWEMPPGKDPEPTGGLTTATVLQNAFDLDPAQIYTVS